MAINKKKVAVIVGGVAAVAIVGGAITAFALNSGNSAEAEAAPEATEAAAETSIVQFDLTSKNADDRPRIDPVPEAVEALEASGFTPIDPGKLTVVGSAYIPPLSFLAEDDNVTRLGSEADFAQLIADGLGLELKTEIAAWADWPLGIQSGKYDLITSNVTVTEERKDLFDFATYRDDVLGFYVKADSDIDSISEAKDVAGLSIVVGSGTNQEKILLAWDEENKAAGLDPVDFQYYEDDAAATLAVQSGRVDATFGPNATAAYKAATDGKTKLVGQLNGGFPDNAQIAAGTAKDNGLIEAVNIVLNYAIENGEYDAILERWGLESEAVKTSEINPPGLPRP
ncbi:ABC transporter substrate-binding protein [Agromyces atrinae]|uniref:ABC transporter substrate-binding protein n=1 Tax=Agromyces atrinae TaxID=592376 RepID=A0A4Q2M4T0_9MICO|nr:ABC transporter substrate-binding protein [Agromyces atrinae]MCI2957356.1 ABC transporter substrate-binding protein [Agromyces atrinae]NYD67312.1 polar amino acid transport system substrate-binding protein [Agromyces atrinae]RXZ86858.1 ABC transporter substrate-binding protein [Agromyces atrinae]